MVIKSVRVEQTTTFAKIVKKLKANQRYDLEAAIRSIIKNPQIGVLKVADLNDVRVYKFSMNNGLCLLAYNYNKSRGIITLMAVGPHENFYRDLKHNN